jgi:precorrin-6B methylase 2
MFLSMPIPFKKMRDFFLLRILNRPLVFALNKILPFCQRLSGFYKAHENIAKFATPQSVFAKKTVLNGPFKGMVYPDFLATGSVLFPKLLGSYEYEIASLVEALCLKKYDAVIDIGSAEGYYAVGFAMRLPSSRVYAFDSDAKALSLCKKMAQLNNVTVHCGNFCSKETLQTLNLGNKSLLISDCEGYETQLFDRQMATILKNHDLLIETHDPLNLECSTLIRNSLSTTHNLIEFESVDDYKKPFCHDFKELRSFSISERFELLRESRLGLQKWIFAESKNIQ